MNRLSEHNPVTAHPVLDHFKKQILQTSVEATYIEEVRPVAQLNTGGHVEFVINNAINEYVKVNETTLSLGFRVVYVKDDGTDMTDAEYLKVSLANNFLESLWANVGLSIGDTQVTSSLQTHGYCAYIQTILGSTPQG